MADSLCGVPFRDSHGSAHNGVGGETAVEQVSQHSESLLSSLRTGRIISVVLSEEDN